MEHSSLIAYFESPAGILDQNKVILLLTLSNADLEKDDNVSVDIPMGLKNKGMVLKPKKNLYGLRQNTISFWNQYLKR